MNIYIYIYIVSLKRINALFNAKYNASVHWDYMVTKGLIENKIKKQKQCVMLNDNIHLLLECSKQWC